MSIFMENVNGTKEKSIKKHILLKPKLGLCLLFYGKIALERKKKGIKKHILVKLCNKQNILKKNKGGITYVLDS